MTPNSDRVSGDDTYFYGSNQNATIEFAVDVYGQEYTQAMLDDILARVYELTRNNDLIIFITD